MNSLFQLDIPRRSVKCSHQGEALLPGMEVYSLLIEEGEDARMGRRDFCAACWQQVRDVQCAARSARGFWRAKIEAKKNVEQTNRVERALALLLEFLREPEPPEADIFVLGLFLARARRLALRQEFQREGSSYYLYEILKQDSFITVKVVELSNLQIGTLQKSLAERLH